MYSSRRTGPPTWFVSLIGIALVFGAYYVWVGIQNYAESGGQSITNATQLAQVNATETAVRLRDIQAGLPTLRPTSTPGPQCQEYVVVVDTAIRRRDPSVNAAFIDSLEEGDIVCVIQQEPGLDWYLVDRDRITRRIEPVYMHIDLIEPRELTPTPSLTPTFAPTVTPESSPTLIPVTDNRPTVPSIDVPQLAPTVTLTPSRTPDEPES